MERILTEQSQEDAFFVVVRQDSLGLNNFWDHEQVQPFQDVVNLCDQVCSILDELIDTSTFFGEDAARDGENFPSLFQGPFGGNECSALKWCKTIMSRF